MIIKKKDTNWTKYHTLVFDFDGVFTNNKVYVNEKGIESIICDRGDGLGLNILKKFINLNLPKHMRPLKIRIEELKISHRFKKL